MKILQHALFSATSIVLLAPSAAAQTVQSITVEKHEFFLKTSSGPASLKPGPFGSAGFNFWVTGLDLGAIAPPKITIAPGSLYPSANPTAHNGGFLVFNIWGEWDYGFFPGADGGGVAFPTPGQDPTNNVNIYFRNGPYSINILGTMVNFNLAADALGSTLPTTPNPSFSQGTWIDGKLHVDPALPLTITTNTFGAYTTGGVGGYVGLFLWGAGPSDSVVVAAENFSRITPPGVTPNETPGGIISVTIPANTLLAGEVYEGEANNRRIVSASTQLPGSYSIAGYRRRTEFLIVADDKVAPVITAPNMLVEATSAAGAVVNFEISAADNVDGTVTPSTSIASGTLFPIGTTTVSVSATDATGNTSTGSFSVTVHDTGAPEIVDITWSPDLIWPVNHKMVEVQFVAVVRDATDPSPATKIVAVSSNESVNAKGDGNTETDWQITGPMKLDLRAERSGNAAGRIYTITIEAQDKYGNAATRQVTIAVSHNK